MAETPYENENWPDLIDDEVKTHQKFEDCFKKRTVELTTEENIPYVPKIIRQLRTWYIKLCKETKDFDNEKRLLQEKVSEESDLNKNLKGQVENLTRKNQELNHEVKNKDVIIKELEEQLKRAQLKTRDKEVENNALNRLVENALKRKQDPSKEGPSVRRRRPDTQTEL